MNDLTDNFSKINEGFSLLAAGLTAALKCLNEANVAQLIASKASPATSPLENTRTCTLPEAAERLGVSRSTIDRLCKDGELNVTVDPRSGWRRVIDDSILDYFRRHKKQAA